MVLLSIKQKRSRRYKNLLKKIKSGLLHNNSINNAVELLFKNHLIKPTKFDESIDLSLNFSGVKVSKKDKFENKILGLTNNLPFPILKKKKNNILLFSKKYKKSIKRICLDKKNFSVFFGSEEKFINKKKIIIKEKIFFSISDYSSLKFSERFFKNSNLNKNLVPRISNGTVIEDKKIIKVIEKILNGRITLLRVNKMGVICITVGKYSFKKEDVIKNIFSILKLLDNKKYFPFNRNKINNISISSTMSPNIKITNLK
jgi:large subunit ribosomal protein L1